MKVSDLSAIIKKKALSLGFSSCGIAKAETPDQDNLQLRKWLDMGMHGEMQYMERYPVLRNDPEKILPGARSMITIASNYYPGELNWGNESYRISRYALGQDYHDVLKQKLQGLLDFIKGQNPGSSGKIFVDTGPVMEKVWAQKAGLGWLGKNSLLLTREFGSWVFLGILITDLELSYDIPEKDHCGNCHLCLDACPTGAIILPGVIDSRKCISYLTIEKKGFFSDSDPIWNHWIFGCDTCQEVCPWNHKAKQTQQAQFLPRQSLLKLNDSDWNQLSEKQFRSLFHKSAVKRTKWQGLKRNISRIEKNKDYA